MCSLLPTQRLPRLLLLSFLEHDQPLHFGNLATGIGKIDSELCLWHPNLGQPVVMLHTKADALTELDAPCPILKLNAKERFWKSLSLGVLEIQPAVDLAGGVEKEKLAPKQAFPFDSLFPGTINLFIEGSSVKEARLPQASKKSLG